jgi:hypothetical protein
MQASKGSDRFSACLIVSSSFIVIGSLIFFFLTPMTFSSPLRVHAILSCSSFMRGLGYPCGMCQALMAERYFLAACTEMGLKGIRFGSNRLSMARLDAAHIAKE